LRIRRAFRLDRREKDIPTVEEVLQRRLDGTNKTVQTLKEVPTSEDNQTAGYRQIGNLRHSFKTFMSTQEREKKTLQTVQKKIIESQLNEQASTRNLEMRQKGKRKTKSTLTSGRKGNRRLETSSKRDTLRSAITKSQSCDTEYEFAGSSGKTSRRFVKNKSRK
jgi:hypothetical protein